MYARLVARLSRSFGLFSLALGASLGARPEVALAFPLVSTSSDAPGALRAEAGLQLFARVAAEKSPDSDWTNRYSLQRARLQLSAEVGDFVQVVLEPDFAGVDADLADAYLRVRPIKALDFTVGQHKTPFGVFESISRWRLPSLTRGMISEIVFNRLAFGDRKLGAMARLRLKSLPLKPSLEAGAYGDFSTATGADGAGRLTARLLKDAEVALSVYHLAGGLVGGGHSNAGALAFEWDRGGWFLAIELILGRARLLSARGLPSERDATFLTGRGLFSIDLEPIDSLVIEPFMGVGWMDPNVRTRDDQGLELLGGANLRFTSFLRLGLQASWQAGQQAFVASDLVRLMVFAGASLE